MQSIDSSQVFMWVHCLLGDSGAASVSLHSHSKYLNFYGILKVAPQYNVSHCLHSLRMVEEYDLEACLGLEVINVDSDDEGNENEKSG